MTDGFISVLSDLGMQIVFGQQKGRIDHQSGLKALKEKRQSKNTQQSIQVNCEAVC